jgi:hypothetical protein
MGNRVAFTNAASPVQVVGPSAVNFMQPGRALLKQLASPL